VWVSLTPTPVHSYTTHPNMYTVPKKYLSLGFFSIELVSIILETWYGVAFFHFMNDEVSNILAYVITWWQLSIVSVAVLFCIYVYNTVMEIKKAVEGMKDSIDEIKDSIDEIKNTRLKGIETSIENMGNNIEDIKNKRLKSIETTIGEIKDSIVDMKKDVKEDMKNTMTTEFTKSNDQMRRLLGDMLGGVKPDVRDPGEMLRQFKKIFMENIIFVSKTGQENADIQKKADIVFTWLKDSQFSIKDISEVDLGIEGNALELLVRGGHMDHALN